VGNEDKVAAAISKLAKMKVCSDLGIDNKTSKRAIMIFLLLILLLLVLLILLLFILYNELTFD
jgi:uncharacterized integral membrane protein